MRDEGWYTRRVSRYGFVALVVALVGGFLWAAHDINSSHSSTAAVGWLVVPVLLFLITCVVVGVDRIVYVVASLTHRPQDPPPESDDFSGLPRA